MTDRIQMPSQLSRSNRVLASLPVRMGLKGIEGILRLAAIVFMLVPAGLTLVLSFSNHDSFVFPPREWGLRQYQVLFESASWIKAITTSLWVALPAAVLTLVIAVPAVFALNRTKMPLRGLVTTVGLAPIVLPSVAYAVALYTFFLQMGVLGSRLWLILVYGVLSVPFVILIAGATIDRIPRELELVAMTLGASRWRAMVGITLRLLLPAIGASFVFAFIHSFDEATFINFIGGPGLITLPKAIYDSVRTGLDPVIMAIAALLMVFTALITGIATYWRRSGTR